MEWDGEHERIGDGTQDKLMVVDRRSLLTGVLTSVAMGDKLIEREEYRAWHGEDMAEIPDWNWDSRMTFGAARSTEADNV